MKTWHFRFGHPCDKTTKEMIHRHNLSAIKGKYFCKSCIVSKHHRLPYNLIHTKEKYPLDLIYGDVWGPSPHLYLFGHRYYLLLMDDYNRFN